MDSDTPLYVDAQHQHDSKVLEHGSIGEPIKLCQVIISTSPSGLGRNACHVRIIFHHLSSTSTL